MLRTCVFAGDQRINMCVCVCGGGVTKVLIHCVWLGEGGGSTKELMQVMWRGGGGGGGVEPMKELIRVPEGGGGEDQGINICVCGWV